VSIFPLLGGLLSRVRYPACDTRVMGWGFGYGPAQQSIDLELSSLPCHAQGDSPITWQGARKYCDGLQHLGSDGRIHGPSKCSRVIISTVLVSV
jgi:hypothetical protein